MKIEKSKEGINFESSARIAAVKILTNQYAGMYDDDKAGEGTFFYRLKVNKMSGAFNYSAVKILNLLSGAQLNIAPNPVINLCTVAIPASYINQSHQINLLIYNSAGLLVQEKK
ncbi:MAG: hypothetical protein NVSMB7_08880 [Chitinophagaceae bacterium]